MTATTGTNTINVNATGSGNLTLTGHKASDDNTYNLQATGSGTTAVDGGEGGTFVLGAVTENLASINGTVTIDGGEGSGHSLTVNDQNGVHGEGLTLQSGDQIWITDSSGGLLHEVATYANLATSEITLNPPT